MPFDILKYEMNRTVVYKEVEYRVVEVLGSGLLLVIQEDELKLNNYPIQTYVIPEE